MGTGRHRTHLRENMMELRRKMAELNGKTLVQLMLPMTIDKGKG